MAQIVTNEQMDSTSDRAAASPSPSSWNTAAKELVALFDCPVCSVAIRPPIIQCGNGHLVCKSCRKRLSCCHSCRTAYADDDDIRNLALEKVANNLMFPCGYREQGCRKSLKLREKAKHEKQCEYHTYNCPNPENNNCCWEGTLRDMPVHLVETHKGIRFFEGDDIVFLAKSINRRHHVEWIMVQHCLDHHFILLLRKQRTGGDLSHFCLVVQLIGTREEANNFEYRLLIESNGEMRGRIGKPRSFLDDIPSIIQQLDCMILDVSAAYRLADYNGDIKINVIISRSEG